MREWVPKDSWLMIRLNGLERKFWKSKTYSTVLATIYPTLEKSGSRTSFCQHKCRARKIECFKFVSHIIFCIFLFYIWCIIYICILVHLDRFELYCKTMIYGNTGYGVSSPGLQNPRNFCRKLKCFKWFFDIFWIVIVSSLQNLGTFLLNKLF